MTELEDVDGASPSAATAQALALLIHRQQLEVDLGAGRALYRRYCASCHGDAGDGDLLARRAHRVAHQRHREAVKAHDAAPLVGRQRLYAAHEGPIREDDHRVDLAGDPLQGPLREGRLGKERDQHHERERPDHQTVS